jgi:hypothetical protein
MNKKLEMLALATLFTVSGVIIKDTQVANANLVPRTTVTHQDFTNTNSTILSQGYGQPQGSPWGQVVAPETYTNPDTGQEFCFYSSARWAPCPNHGTTAIIPQNAKCIGSNTMQAGLDQCPRARCELVRLQASLSALSNNGYSTPALPCNGLP